jgi:FkbM family methyltransferase
MRAIVYDFGAHNGNNIPYYLLRFDCVVAVEANPDLALQIRRRFKNEISEGRLIVENCVVSKIQGEVDFYIHKTNSVLSQLSRPDKELHNFFPTKLTSRRPSEIIQTYGSPKYVKVDVEYTDFDILENLFDAGIYPPYLSAEVHDIRVFSILTSSRHYEDFKIVDGHSVQELYRNVDIGGYLYSFPYHSAGPFYEDIPTKVMTATELFLALAKGGLGWKDIHAKKIGTNI